MRCYGCPKKAVKELRTLPMCTGCYVLALEHCGDWELDFTPEPVPPIRRSRTGRWRKKEIEECLKQLESSVSPS